MTPKQKAFCDYYIASGNATESAEKAGYSPKTAYAIGAENLKKLEIQNYIKEHTQTQDKERIATAQEVLEFYSNILRDESEPTKNRIRAAENLSKRFGIDRPAIDDKAENSGAVVNIVIADTSGKENDNSL